MLEFKSSSSSTEKVKCVVRVQTEAYKKGDTYFYGKSIRVLKRKTTYDFVKDEVDNIGIIDGLENIINLSGVHNGVYEVVVAHESYDFESGYLDDWSFKLVPYEVNSLTTSQHNVIIAAHTEIKGE